MRIQNLKSLKRATAVAVACCTVLGSLLVAQIRNRTHEDQEETPQPPPTRRTGKTPRAVGVLEITGGDARLIPVSILIDGKFYDASVYKADPQPMAVEPQTVYEGQKTGEPAGLFTITSTQELNGNWVGLGVWSVKRPGSENVPKEVTVGKSEASDRPRGMDDNEGPPKLRRSGSSKTSEKTAPQTPDTAAPPPTSGQTASAGAAGSSTPDKPAADEKSAGAKTAGTPSLARPGDKQAENQPVVPPLPTPTEAKPTAQSGTAGSRDSAEEGGRPVLRRGGAGGEQADKIPAPAAMGGSGKTAKAPNNSAHAAVGYRDTLVAVSDAGGPTPRAFTMMLKPDERTGYEHKMMQYASEALRKFAVTHPIRSRQTPNVALTDVQMQVFDVNSSNEPILVFTARAPETVAPEPAKPSVRSARSSAQSSTKKTDIPAQAALPTPLPSADSTAFQYYVTVVARVDINGDVRKLFESVTDTSHLDAIPRLQLIDCVDANGDGVGELLFRENYDRSRAFAIYRVGMDQLWQLFEGSQASFSAGQ